MSPHQILRAFEISEEFRSTFGYPPLTAELKAKVFGLNTAALFGVDPIATRCAIDAADMAEARIEFASFVQEGLVQSPYAHRGYVTRRGFLDSLRSGTRPWSPI